MSRYIDADALREHLKNKLKTDYEMGLYNHGALTESFLRFVERQPTADVAEVKRGHWIEHKEKPSWLEDDVEIYYNCSLCGTSHWSIIPPYCPECGAKMDGERNETE